MKIVYFNDSFYVRSFSRRIGDLPTLMIVMSSRGRMLVDDFRDLANYMLSERILLVREDHGNVCLASNPRSSRVITIAPDGDSSILQGG